MRKPLWLGLLAFGLLLSAARTQDPASEPSVDLSGEEYESVGEASPDRGEDEHWTKRWFERVHLRGYGAFAYLHTDSGGSRPEGALVVNQASLFLEADLDADTTLAFEIMTDRFAQNSSSDIRIGETYAELRGLLEDNEDAHLAVRVGRFDIPFGEYYRYQDSPDNPLVSYSVPLPYGLDEGVMAFGEYHGIGFRAAFLDGSYDRQGSNGFAKSGVLKLSGEPVDDLYVSGSVLVNGDSSGSALCFAGTAFMPVGKFGSSTLGNSPSSEVSGSAVEANARYSFGDDGYLHLSFGHARTDDDIDAFDRDFTWFVIEPSILLCPSVRATARYSEIGTYDGNEGYRFEAKQYGNGSATYGYDTKRVSRLAVGAAWQASKHVLLKGEVGMDRFESIDASSIPTDDRAFVGLELVLIF